MLPSLGSYNNNISQSIILKITPYVYKVKILTYSLSHVPFSISQCSRLNSSRLVIFDKFLRICGPVINLEIAS